MAHKSHRTDFEYNNFEIRNPVRRWNEVDVLVPWCLALFRLAGDFLLLKEVDACSHWQPLWIDCSESNFRVPDCLESCLSVPVPYLVPGSLLHHAWYLSIVSLSKGARVSRMAILPHLKYICVCTLLDMNHDIRVVGLFPGKKGIVLLTSQCNDITIL
jgi:hypothetical protein